MRNERIKPGYWHFLPLPSNNIINGERTEISDQGGGNSHSSIEIRADVEYGTGYNGMEISAQFQAG